MERNNNQSRRADKPAETILSSEERANVDEMTSLEEQMAALEARYAEKKAEAARAEAWGSSDPIMTVDADGSHADFDDYLKMRTDAENAVNEEPTFEDVDYKNLSLMQLVGEGRKMSELGDIAGKEEVLETVRRQITKRATAEGWTDKEVSFQIDRLTGLMDSSVEVSTDANTSESTPEEPAKELMVDANGTRIYTAEEADEIMRKIRESKPRKLNLVSHGIPAMPNMIDDEVEASVAEAEPAKVSLKDEILGNSQPAEADAEKTSNWAEFSSNPVSFISSRLAARFGKKSRAEKRANRELETDEDRENRRSSRNRTIGTLALIGAVVGGGAIALNTLENNHQDDSSDKPASVPQSEDNKNKDILSALNPAFGESINGDGGYSAEPVLYDPSTALESSPVNIEAGNVAPGGGWYEVMEGLDIPNSEREALLNKVGPELASQGYAYAENGEYRITSPGQLPASVLELIQNNR